MLGVEVLDSGVAVLTVENLDRRNAINMEIRDRLIATFEEFEQDPRVRAVVITGAGSAFCAGADLAVLATADREHFARLYDAFLCVARSPLPSVAAVNGAAVGAGLNLALACDARVAGPRARFIAGFLSLGLHPGGGCSWMLERLVGPGVAAEMILFAKELDAAGAERAGLATRSAEDQEVVAAAVELASGAAKIPAELTARAKDTLRQLGSINGLGAAVELELEAQAWSARQSFFQPVLDGERNGSD